ncbi:MAG: sugar transferase [Candidatus Doudnabacteria bacterium]|nr:sugar transferase [Candidatus Doudnabacteria bacterium]
MEAMKRSELLFNLISILVDFLMVMLSGIAAFYFRFRLEEVRPILYNLQIADYLRVLFLVSPLIILLLAAAGLYNLKGTRRLAHELYKIVLAISSGLLLVVILFFFNQTVFPSRLIILLSWALAIVLVSIGRVLLRIVQISALKRGVGLHKLVVIDLTDNPSATLVSEIKSRPELGYKIVGIVNYREGDADLIARLEDLRKSSGIDDMLQVNPAIPHDVNNRLLQFCRDYGIKFNFVPDLFETSKTAVDIETIAGVPIIVLKGTPLEGWGRVIKRFVDIVISFLGLVISSPIFLLTALAIRLESKGPVFFHQPRAAGLGSFECYKFRSMYYEMSEGTESGDKLREELEKQNARLGPFVKIRNDPRVTKVGKFIRRTKIDELPQFWHILRGQMSLVGPRVHMVKEVEKFQDNYKKIFIIKPGATGLTQITQAYNPELSFEEEIRLDTFYIENWSIWLDFYIIFKTILILLGQKPKVDY